jgi:uncharacterized protein YjbI with pentapeptide repeats
MPDDAHLAVLRRGAAAWNAWRAKHDEAPDLSRAGLRGLDLSGSILQAPTRRSQNSVNHVLARTSPGAHLEAGNLLRAVLDRGDLAGAFLNGRAIPELRPAGLHPKLAIGVPRRR